jgi:NADH-quinone oxidoreductase subunit M
MGFVVLGLFSFTEQGMQGALYQMLNHGVSTGALFLFVGMVYERRHTRLISQFGGLCHRMPVFSTLLVIASMSSIGLPLLNGFVGEFLILLGIRGSTAITWPGLATALAGLGVILSAVYMLWMLQRVVFGAITHEENAQLKDLNLREIGLVTPLMILMLVMGVAPNLFMNKTRAAVGGVRTILGPKAGGAAEQQPPQRRF